MKIDDDELKMVTLLNYKKCFVDILTLIINSIG